MRSAVELKLKALIERNRTRMNYQERFERLIADYNAGSLNVQQFFDQLVALASDLTAEDKRAVAETSTKNNSPSSICSPAPTSPSPSATVDQVKRRCPRSTGKTQT